MIHIQILSSLHHITEFNNEIYIKTEPLIGSYEEVTVKEELEDDLKVWADDKRWQPTTGNYRLREQPMQDQL